MEMQEMRYHPLVDGDSEGTEKVPLFQTISTEGISAMYLAEMISGYFRLWSKEPITDGECNKWKIRCPQCGGELRKIMTSSNTTKLGMYTCDKCRG